VFRQTNRTRVLPCHPAGLPARQVPGAPLPRAPCGHLVGLSCLCPLTSDSSLLKAPELFLGRCVRVGLRERDDSPHLARVCSLLSRRGVPRPTPGGRGSPGTNERPGAWLTCSAPRATFLRCLSETVALFAHDSGSNTRFTSLLGFCASAVRSTFSVTPIYLPGTVPGCWHAAPERCHPGGESSSSRVAPCLPWLFCRVHSGCSSRRTFRS